jgi:hypothetical protein
LDVQNILEQTEVDLYQVSFERGACSNEFVNLHKKHASSENFSIEIIWEAI